MGFALVLVLWSGVRCSEGALCSIQEVLGERACLISSRSCVLDFSCFISGLDFILALWCSGGHSFVKGVGVQGLVI